MDRTLEDVTRDSFVESKFNDVYSVATDPLFVTLIRNQQFCEKLEKAYRDLAESTFAYENVAEQIGGLESKFEVELFTPYEEYFKQRPKYVLESLERQFS